MGNAINWFEIPAADFDRAVKFYDTVLNIQLRKELFNAVPNAIFPTEGADPAGGAVVFSPDYVPSTQGSLVYLNADGKMDDILKRIPAAGGKVLLPKTSIGDPGYIAILLDTEGNKIGLHQPQ
jgi:predicted enzyme related to lactoylglutathione lyase